MRTRVVVMFACMWLLLLGVPADDVGAALLAVFPDTIVLAGESPGHALLAVVLAVLVRATPSAAAFHAEVLPALMLAPCPLAAALLAVASAVLVLATPSAAAFLAVVRPAVVLAQRSAAGLLAHASKRIHRGCDLSRMFKKCCQKTKKCFPACQKTLPEKQK